MGAGPVCNPGPRADRLGRAAGDALAVLPRSGVWTAEHSGFQASVRVYDQAWITLTALLCALTVGCMEAALGIKIALGSLSSVMLGVFFIVVGNGLGKIRPNSVLGLRTPWTKASVRVWERTHRACAPFFILTGVFLTATGFGMLGAPLNRTIMNLCLLGLVALCYGLSWIYWRQEQKYG